MGKFPKNLNLGKRVLPPSYKTYKFKTVVYGVMPMHITMQNL